MRRNIEVAVQVFYGLLERDYGDDVDILDQRGFACVIHGNHHRADSALSCTQREIEGSHNRIDVPIEAQLAHDGVVDHPVGFYRPLRHQQADSDGQVEDGSFFFHICGREVHGNSVTGYTEPAVFDSGTYPVAAFLDGGVGKPHGIEGELPLGDVDFHIHPEGFNTDCRVADNFTKHNDYKC